MSWGERSCIKLYDNNKSCNPEISICNVDCEKYQWDGKTTPDSVHYTYTKEGSNRITVLSPDYASSDKKERVLESRKQFFNRFKSNRRSVK